MTTIERLLLLTLVFAITLSFGCSGPDNNGQVPIKQFACWHDGNVSFMLPITSYEHEVTPHMNRWVLKEAATNAPVVHEELPDETCWIK